MIDEAFGEVLRRLRDERGMSQEALAEATDLSRPYISELERAVKGPSLRTFARLAQALGVSVSEMMALVEAEAADPLASAPARQETRAHRAQKSLGGAQDTDRP